MTFRQFITTICLLIFSTVSVEIVGSPYEIGEIEVFKYEPAKPIKRLIPNYPIKYQKDPREGWVQLVFMVDTEGKPREIEVSASTGNSRFELAAKNAAKRWRYSAARYDGQVVESSACVKIIFTLEPSSNEVSAPFRRVFLAAREAIRGGNKERAKSYLTSMRARQKRLHEHSCLSVAEYLYREKWDSKSQQLNALTSAIAFEEGSEYLPEEVFLSLLLARFKLQVELKFYQDALDSYDLLIAQESIDEKVKSTLTAYKDRILKIRDVNAPFEVNHRADEAGRWAYNLLWSKFAVASEGDISELLLRCERDYVRFEYDPDLEFAVEGDPGECSLTVIGEPDSSITLYQR